MSARLMLALVPAVALVGDTAAADRAKTPADATVYIRLVGNIHIEVEEFGQKQTADRDQVEIGTGSGFVISPYGYVLTNAHVVGDDDFTVTKGSKKAKVSLKVSRIDVCFPPGAQAARDLASPCLPASVHSTDPVVDLAVLFVSAANLPYVALGDSDALTPGQPIDALGFPFGRQLEIAQSITAPDVVPRITTNPGAISATRSDETGEKRFLQISSNVNPGNSGGPVVDRDGFAVGVTRLKLTDADGIAFAIPINQVKDYLERHGLDPLMPAHRMRLGPFQSATGKGLGLRAPEGAFDGSPFRSRVEIDAKPVEIALRIDRVLSSWNVKQVEQVLVGSQSFEPFSAASSDSRTVSAAGEPAVLVGRASGTGPQAAEDSRMEYAIVDLGDEKLVARYIGPAAEMAFNASVLRESLTSLEAQRLLGRDADPTANLQWSPAAMTDSRTRLPVPAGWLVEPRAPSTCTGLPPAAAVIAASPANDFTLNVRAAVWPAADVDPERAAAACSSRRGSLGAASYALPVEWLGVRYTLEGVFTRVGPWMAQLEVAGRNEKSAAVRALLVAWSQSIP